MRRLKFHPPGPKKSNACSNFLKNRGGIHQQKYFAESQKNPCVFAVLWYSVSMIKNQYSTAELTASLGNPYFVGLNLRVWRVATKGGAYEFKAHRTPRTDFWSVNKKKLR